jgi:signal transduction histidine kinase
MSRSDEIFSELYDHLAIRTDRTFAWIFVFQWFMGITLALTLSPQTWAGSEGSLHPHLYQAIFLGAAIAVLPVYLIWKQPGATLNRYAVSVGQILFSILFIHLMDGRIEAHFHIFGSLAFLAFYRDWKVLLLATLLTATDHLVRGFYWPLSVYGVLNATPLRALEHAAWVVFEDAFLFYSIHIGREELHAIAEKQSSLEDSVSHVERQVEIRTQELQASQDTVLAQQQSLTSSAKLSALGEMAAGIAHEINNPLAIISTHSSQLKEMIEENESDRTLLLSMADKIEQTAQRIAKIIKGLRSFSRDAGNDSAQLVRVSQVVDDTLSFCREKLKSNGVQITVEVSEDLLLFGRSTEISQVLLNLLNNASDALQEKDEKWIKITATENESQTLIRITDSGPGISNKVKQKLFQPFFTTKALGKGTGLGLSISLGIIESHQGTLTIDDSSPHTCFLISLPKPLALVA